MKANAPERLWLAKDRGAVWITNPDSKKYIEYTRTDAFIEKACDWLNNFYNEDTHSYLIDEDIEKFINYMKGE